MIRQRVPTIAGTETDVNIEQRHQGRSPPTRAVIPVRTPRPIIIVVNPSSPVIRLPAPGLIANPRPPIRRDPGPMTVAIWSPVIIVVNDGDARSPNPSVIICVNPAAIGIEIFTAPNRIVVITHVVVVLEPGGEISFSLNDPVIPTVFRNDFRTLPIAGIRAFISQRRDCSFSNSKAGCIRIDSSPTTIENG